MMINTRYINNARDKDTFISHDTGMGDDANDNNIDSDDTGINYL